MARKTLDILLRITLQAASGNRQLQGEDEDKDKGTCHESEKQHRICLLADGIVNEGGNILLTNSAHALLAWLWEDVCVFKTLAVNELEFYDKKIPCQRIVFVNERALSYRRKIKDPP